MAKPNWWNQLYDPKEGRKTREIPRIGICDECKMNNGHRLDCSQVTMDHLAAMVQYAQQQETFAKERAKRYWEQLQRAVGRVAVLRQENNKLRRKAKQADEPE